MEHGGLTFWSGVKIVTSVIGAGAQPLYIGQVRRLLHRLPEEKLLMSNFVFINRRVLFHARVLELVSDWK